MKFFTKQEFIGVLSILCIIAIVTGINMSFALLRARDSQRMSDLGAITNGLDAFFEEYRFLPPSENGMIKACRGEGYEEVLAEFEEIGDYDYSKLMEKARVCRWGEDPLPNLIDETKEPFVPLLYNDPRVSSGLSYYYVSNTRRFQLFAYLEEEEKAVGYNKDIVIRGLPCGVKTCSFGKSFADTPLTKTIEEYEEEVRIKNEIEKQKRLRMSVDAQ